ncbi:MAG TPA: epimerase [Candidatus Accumulibacter sp.]|nr:epimerase [Accumulibacter sp.]
MRPDQKPVAAVPTTDLERILELCEPIWARLRGRRFLITGGTGFFGTWLLESIAAANAALGLGLTASIVSRDPAAYRARFVHLGQDPAFTWIAGSAADFPCPSMNHDFLLHLATATCARTGQTDSRLMLSAKLEGIRHVIDVARKTGIRRALVTSSGAVYGPQPPQLATIPETYAGAPDPTKRESAYGNGKRLVEQFCAVNDDIDIVIARCFAFVGPHLPLDGRFAAGNFIRDALAGEPITIHGDGTGIRSYLYVGDLIVWLLTMLIGAPGRTAYNVGSDEPISIFELAQRVSALTGHTEIRILEAPGHAPPERYVPCIDRVRTLTGLNVFTSLDRSLEKTLDWYSGTASSVT